MVHRPRFFVIFILIPGLFLLAACQASPTLIQTQAPGLSPTIPPTHTPRATPTPAPTSTWTATATTIPSPTSTATLVPTPTATPTRSPQQAQEILSSQLEEYASTVENISYTMTSSNTIEITTADWDGNPVVSEAFQINDRGMAEFSAFPPLSPTDSITQTAETHELSPDRIHFDAKFNKLVAVDDAGIATHVFYPDIDGGTWLNVGYGAGMPKDVGQCWAVHPNDMQIVMQDNPQGTDAQGNPLPQEGRYGFMVGTDKKPGLVEMEELLSNIIFSPITNVRDIKGDIVPFDGLRFTIKDIHFTSCVLFNKGNVDFVELGYGVSINDEEGIMHTVIPYNQLASDLAEHKLLKNHVLVDILNGKEVNVEIWYTAKRNEDADRLPGVGEMWKEQNFNRNYMIDYNGVQTNFGAELISMVVSIFDQKRPETPIIDIEDIIFPGAVVAINQ